MAQLKLHCNCGCGADFGADINAASSHADTTGHKLTISGSVSPYAGFERPRKSRARAYQAKPSVKRTQRTVQPSDVLVEQELEIDTAYEKLRNRMKRR